MLLADNLKFTGELELFCINLEDSFKNLADCTISFPYGRFQEGLYLLISLANRNASSEEAHVRVFGHMFSFRDEFLDNQLVVVIFELDSVDDVDIFVEFWLSVNHRQVCDHVVVR